MFLITGTLANKTESCEILPCVLSDHSAVKLNIKTDEQQRGPGLWKMNNEFLQDNDYCKIIEEMITRIYVTHSHMSKMQLWELIKHEKVLCHSYYFKSKAQHAKNKKYNLFKLLEGMQTDWIANPLDTILARNINRLEVEIDTLHEKDTQRSAFRCHMKYYEHGDKC